ncbi:hypothetical protein E8E12_002975 [Didymella heteroderae]|uniref:Heterokaryon incompatibility domain-containing protein n=1 Tax=Didymella heteroderae TaxID=1769908 RepID=A0A9P4WII0_9PLEO|nr:hypothetical protein E8E12_002975 [Didymella heteroderae]
MRQRLRKMLHRTKQSAEAESSSAAAAREQNVITTTETPEDVNRVPGIVYGKEAEEAVYETINNSKWRKAFWIDGELRWATQEGSGIGEKVSEGGAQTWKMIQVGDTLYLAPKEAHEGTKDDVETANEKRIETFLDKVAASMVAQSTKIPPPTYDEIRPLLSENVGAIMMLYTRDGVLATDVHGRLDNDFDNPGPRLNKETQFTTRGHHSALNPDKDPVFERLERQLAQTLGFGSKNGTGEANDEEPGYESGGSEVSQERCRESPAYPMCKDDCWLKQASSIRGSAPLATGKGAELFPLDLTNIYSELEPGFTRVLEIEAGSNDECIRCTLEPMEILGAREQNEGSPVTRRLYEALSYTWGDSTKCRTIECNGKTFGVSQNLFEALINIRLPDRTRAIWIDALCINQEDDAEKSKQVQYMYSIYRAATRVVVWLGMEADDSDFVMWAMHLVGRKKKRSDIMRRDHHHECLVQLARLIKGIDLLVKRPWFSRSWIRQEIAAAPKVTVRCGSKEVPWNAMKRSVNCLVRLRSKYVASRCLFNGTDNEFEELVGSYKEKSYALRFLKKDWIIGQSLLAEGGDLRSIWYYHTGGMLELLMTSRAYDATNARDKVYAILGMAGVPLNPQEPSPSSAWALDRKKKRPAMRVDYSASVSEVYQYTAKYLINRDENLDILCILPTHRNADSDDLPSWIPDWRVPLSSRPLYDGWDYISYKWGASGFTTTISQDQDDIGQLRVTGFEIARIQQLLPLFPESLPHPPESPAGSAVPFEEGKHPRRFAQSTRGPSVVPSTAVVSDAIWILHGCKMPVVLREATSKLDTSAFRVVGPCFVSTIMFGEAIEWLEEGQHNLASASIVLV